MELSRFSVYLAFAALLLFSRSAFAVDASLAPAADDSSQIAGVYQDMIVVQHRAKEKKGHALFETYGTIEFSDGPQSIYTLNFSVGYAFSNELEMYFSVAPVFLKVDGGIKKQVADLDLANGQKASLESPEPKIQYGLETLWLPAYGKESWSPFSIVRSDTFFKLYLGTLQFNEGAGFRGSLGIGKTFFLSPYFNPRISASFCAQETFVNQQKYLSKLGLFELGSTWYF